MHSISSRYVCLPRTGGKACSQTKQTTYYGCGLVVLLIHKSAAKIYSLCITHPLYPNPCTLFTQAYALFINYINPYNKRLSTLSTGLTTTTTILINRRVI